MLRRLFPLLFIISLACQPKGSNTHAKSDIPPSDSISSEDIASISTNELAIRVQNVLPPSDSIAPDSNTNSGSNDPADAAALPLTEGIQILRPGTFHGDEVPEDVGKLPWLGLFPNDLETFVLRKTEIIATRVVDGLLDNQEKGEKTGWEITAENGQYPTLLISGGDLTEGKVDLAEVPGTLYPGDSAQVEFKGVQYLLYATGEKQADSVRGVAHVSDYSLYVVRTENGESLRTLLVNHKNFDDAMTSIIWSGDLDRDGYMDFLIDISRHYNQRLPTLFLSKPAKKEHVVIPVAEQSSVGC